ncbi:fatty acid desaturase domain-containing protein [Hirsutella rhossiliensis]
MLLGLWKATTVLGYSTILLAYGIPWLWINHWLIAVAFMNHTHPSLLHYNDSSWTFIDGALSTIDRHCGLIGLHMFHGLLDYHVIHHLFPRIPFYHAEEATMAIKPLLGASPSNFTKLDRQSA